MSRGRDHRRLRWSEGKSVVADLRLTIFTPAYNRAHLLPRLFESIAAQVDVGRSIEWLVIDDGSTDDTPSVLNSFVARRRDLVRSIRTENGGKHRAVNRAAREARGEWVFLVDSDDALVDGVVPRLLEVAREYGRDPSVGVLRGLKRFPSAGAVRFEFHTAGKKMHHRDWMDQQQSFDTAEMVRADALRAHPFPEYPGERFMAEGWLWLAIDGTHKLICLNEAWVDCWYQPEGLSAQSARTRAASPRGAMDVYRAIGESSRGWRTRSRAAANWWRYALHAGLLRMDVNPYRASLAGLPIGAALYVRDRMRLLG